MSIVRNFGAEQPERPQGTEHFIPRKSEGRSARAVARGSLACPSCDLPVVRGGPIPMAARVRCPFCRDDPLGAGVRPARDAGHDAQRGARDRAHPLYARRACAAGRPSTRSSLRRMQGTPKS